MRPSKYEMRAISATALAAAAAGFLSGCGGSSLSSSPLAATPDSSPVIYGLNAQAAVGGAFKETSGVGFTDPTAGLTSVITGATGYKTDDGPGPLPLYQSAFATGIPTGFAPGGAYIVGAGTAFPTTYTGNMTFRAYISTGVKNNNRVDLVPSSVVLTSSEDTTFSQPLTFDSAGIGNGPLGQGQYAATFPVPAAFKTSGLHNLHTVVADVQAQKSETDFAFLALAPTDSAAEVQVNFTNKSNQTAPVAGAVATITNALPGVAAYKDAAAPTGADALPTTTSYADAQGIVILFAAPGTQTVTVTGVNPFDGKTVVTGTVQVKLDAGAVDTADSIDTTASTAAASAKTVARVKLILHKKQ